MIWLTIVALCAMSSLLSRHILTQAGTLHAPPSLGSIPGQSSSAKVSSPIKDDTLSAVVYPLDSYSVEKIDRHLDLTLRKGTWERIRSHNAPRFSNLLFWAIHEITLEQFHNLVYDLDKEVSRAPCM